MKKLITILLALQINVFAQQYGTIQGKVIDKTTRQPIPYANILLVGTNYGTATDQKGEFKLKNIPVGRYIIKVSSIGYNTITNSDLIVSTGHPVDLIFELTESVIPLKEEVVVRGELFQKDPMQMVGTHSLGYEEIRRAPGAAGDLSRAILIFPSVIQTTDNRNDLLVRGGNPSENLYLIDNIEISNINHFGTQGAGGGAIGMLNVNLIRELNFSTGGFSVKYGDKLSSVLDIKLRDGNREEHKGDLNLSMSGFGVILEGPFSSKGSYLISARRSYLDIIAKLNATGVKNISVIPNYYNFQSKINFNLNEQNSFSLIGIGGIDKVRFKEGEYNFDLFFKDYRIANDQDQSAIGFNWRRLWSKNLFSIMTLSNTYNHFFTDVTNHKTNFIFYRNKSFEREYHIKSDFNYKPNAMTELIFGGGIKFINFSHSIIYSGDTLFIDQGDKIDTAVYNGLDYAKTSKATKTFFYLQLLKWINEKFNFNLGLRWDNFSFVNQSNVLSYRGGASYFLTPVTTISLYYGLFHQTPPYIWLSADESAKNLKIMKCQHYIISFEHLFTEDLKLTIEAYYKKYSNIPTSKSSPHIIASNEGTKYGPFLMTNLTSNGNGFSKGIEFSLQKKLLNKIYGMLSYSNSKTRFTAEDGIERDGSFDYRHLFTLSFGYIPDEFYEFSFKWRFVDGRPYTPFNESLSKIFKRGVLDYNKINSLRMPPYHRLDLRVDKRWHFKKWNIVTYIELQNAYFRNNIYEYQWDPIENKKVEIYQWKFFPVFGINALF